MQESRKNPAPSAQTATRSLDGSDEPIASSVRSSVGSDRLTFLRGFVRDPKGVAAIVPSSRWLEQRVVRNAVGPATRCVVELGPGTGGITRALLTALGPASRLMAIELEPDFQAHLRASITDRRFSIELGSAERLEEFLANRRLPAPDAIVSGIPFSTMPFDVGDRIAAAIGRALAPGGRFVAYQWTPVVAERTIPYLGEPRREWEPLNLPPMRVFTWVKPA